ncbi:unnamed protein product [Diamesa hyperborea]
MSFLEDEKEGHKFNLEILPKSSTIVLETKLTIDDNIIKTWTSETPSPTKLIKNCETLGVFDDLNIFDIGFQKAIQNHNECPNSSTLGNTDTLHTPQILNERTLSATIKFRKAENEQTKVPIETTIVDNLIPLTEADKTKQCLTQKQHVKIKPKPIMLGAQTTSNIIQHTSNIVVPGAAVDVKDRLKNIILSNNSCAISQKRLKVGESDSYSEQIKEENTILNGNILTTMISNPTTSTKSSNKLPSNSEPHKTNKTRSNIGTNKIDIERNERNRAAARRYRKKMKIYSQNLQEKYDATQEKLDKFQRENTILKKELNELKKLLLMHKECSVTMAAKE